MSRPVAALGHLHLCPAPRHVGGPIIDAGQSHVRCNGIPLAVVAGKCLCAGIPTTAEHIAGASAVRINGKAIMRVGDATAHGGRITSGIEMLRID